MSDGDGDLVGNLAGDGESGMRAGGTRAGGTKGERAGGARGAMARLDPWLRRGTAAATLAPLLAAPALAQDAFVVEPAFNPVETVAAAIVAGTAAAAFAYVVKLRRERRQTAAEASALRLDAARLRRDNTRLATLADARDRRVVLWTDADGDDPALFGDLPAATGAPTDRATFLGFGRWLRPHSAGLLEHAVAALRAANAPFDLTVETATGEPIEVEGRATGGGRFVRFSPAHPARREESNVRARAARLEADTERLRSVLAALPHPAWTRGGDGAIDWCNAAHARAAGHADPEAAVAAGAEFLPGAALATVRADLADTGEFGGRLTAAGPDADGRHAVWRVTETRTPVGTAGVALDVTDTDAAENALAAAAREHADTLDRVPVAVAAFGEDGHLARWNRAFAALWSLDEATLAAGPTPNALLDRLRSDGRLADSPDWRAWKARVLGAEGGGERTDAWYLPDGRSLRVTVTPHAGRGATWLMEDETERLALAAGATQTQRMRDMSLENLDEGVALFGSDGKLKLANPAFGDLWNLVPEKREPGAHISAIATDCAPAFERPSTLWAGLVEDITTFSEDRRQRGGQVRLAGGRTLNWASRPLPAGQTLLTFVDVSDTVRVADALAAEAEALQRADAVKNAVLGHVSYELRSPLTNVLGFTEVLASEAQGPLTDTQAEYVDYVLHQAGVLKTNVDDIADLVAADAGGIELRRESVSVEEVVADAIGPIEVQLEDHDLTMDLHMDHELGEFDVDPRRVRQIVQNMLQNAVNHTRTGGTLGLSVRREGGAEGEGEGAESVIAIDVTDRGPGMTPEAAKGAFEPFLGPRGGGRQEGGGLGLPMVHMLTTAHGGTANIASDENGTRVSVRLPARPPVREPSHAPAPADAGSGEGGGSVAGAPTGAATDAPGAAPRTASRRAGAGA